MPGNWPGSSAWRHRQRYWPAGATRASQRALDHSARQANLQDACVLAQPCRLDGLHIGLVDDVMTTGATLREAARVLKAHGAARVTALPALRTP